MKNTVERYTFLYMNGLFDNIKAKATLLNDAIPAFVKDKVMTHPLYRQLAWIGLAPLFVLLVNIIVGVGIRSPLLAGAVAYMILCNVVYRIGCKVAVAQRDKQTYEELKLIVNAIKERRRHSFKGDDGSVK